MANILIASLGESPVVVTAMYDLLTQQEGYELDKVVVLRAEGNDVMLGYDLIEEALQGKCVLEPYHLSFTDADNEAACYTFLQTLFGLLSAHQHDSVYLSLAGGRKSMSALMAVVVPLFPCVKKLYHVLSENNEDDFLTIDDLFAGSFSEDERRAAMHPPLEELKLISIPFGEYQYVSDEFRSRLFTINDEDLEDLWDENPELAETTEFYRPGSQPMPVKSMLNIEVTERVQKEYERMCTQDAPRAKRFAICFKQMRNPYRLFDAIHGSGFVKDSFSFHFYKRRRTVERPFYHTEPGSIHLFPKAKVERVIISGLAVEQSDGSYKPTGNELLAYQIKPTLSVDTLLSSGESVLIVPVGKLPMVATQLYSLLKSEGKNIREVVLVHPEARDVRASAAIVRAAFESEKSDVACLDVPVRGLEDVDSTEACEKYESALEETIKGVRERHPGWQIELALSGGRKGMAALAMFVAQRTGIRYVYHTLITDELTRRKVERETKAAVLDRLKADKEARNNRLFLREYETKGEGPYTKFVLFKVPVLPAGKR